MVLIVIAVLVVCAIAYLAIRSIKKHVDFFQTTASIYKITGYKEFDFEIVGEHSYQQALKRIAGAKTETPKEHFAVATLNQEPNNPHDPEACVVKINTETVGYLSKQEAFDFLDELDTLKIARSTFFLVDAVIIGGWKNKDSEGSYGVKLDMPFNMGDLSARLKRMD